MGELSCLQRSIWESFHLSYRAIARGSNLVARRNAKALIGKLCFISKFIVCSLGSDFIRFERGQGAPACLLRIPVRSLYHQPEPVQCVISQPCPRTWSKSGLICSSRFDCSSPFPSHTSPTVPLHLKPGVLESGSPSFLHLVEGFPKLSRVEEKCMKAPRNIQGPMEAAF